MDEPFGSSRGSKPESVGGSHVDTGEPADGRVEHFLRMLLGESMLMPVLLVILGHAVAFFAPVLLFALRDRSLYALAALAPIIVLFLSAVYRDARERRLRATTGVASLIWVLSVLAAYFGDRYGII